MRIRFAALAALSLLAVTTPLRSAEEAQFNWKPWGRLAVQDGGRYKPLDTLSGETFRYLGNRTSLRDPETGRTVDRNQLYLEFLFLWRGWEHSTGPIPASGPHGHVQYFANHQPDKWDRTPLLRVDCPDLRSELGMAKGERYISPFELIQATIAAPETHREQPFLVWGASLLRKEHEELTEFESKSLKTAHRFWSYQDHRMGNRLRFLPVTSDENQKWTSLAELLRAELSEDDATDSLRKVRQQFLTARDAYLANSPKAFNAATLNFLRAVRESCTHLGTSPAHSTVDLEVNYNRWVPFRFAWISMTVAFLCLLLSIGTDWKPFLVCGWCAFASSLLVMIVGFAMRITISGRAPVTNMYESVLYVSLGVAVIGAIFELAYPKRIVLMASTAVAIVGLILADNFPADLEPNLRPLQPVLRNNFWLVTHVMTITLSYAAFALAMGIGNIVLGYFLLDSTCGKTIDSLTRFTYRAMQSGVLLLATGTILGCAWADYAWGRLWGWDPKEVWALIALLGYIAVLHAGRTGSVRQFGTATLSVISFSLVVMSWYGVNFILGVGMHSYGFGEGGAGYVFAALALQGLYVAIAAFRYALREKDECDPSRREPVRAITEPLIKPQAANT